MRQCTCSEDTFNAHVDSSIHLKSVTLVPDQHGGAVVLLAWPAPQTTGDEESSITTSPHGLECPSYATSQLDLSWAQMCARVRRRPWWQPYNTAASFLVCQMDICHVQRPWLVWKQFINDQWQCGTLKRTWLLDCDVIHLGRLYHWSQLATILPLTGNVYDIHDIHCTETDRHQTDKSVSSSASIYIRRMRRQHGLCVSTSAWNDAFVNLYKCTAPQKILSTPPLSQSRGRPSPSSALHA